MTSLLAKPETDRVCIAVMPTEISMAGGDYRYIVCPEPEKSIEAFEKAAASADDSGTWQDGDESVGIWVLYQDEWWSLLCSGDLVGSGRIKAENGKALYDICLETAEKAGLSEAVRPENIIGIKAATLDGAITITDPISLKKIEDWLSSSEEIYGGAGCPFTSRLTLQLENGTEVTVSMATDSCGVWLSEGVYYQYSGGNEEFYQLFPIK
ncbi:MAG: hypothetical protein J6D13_09200 [Clostridium sp.]|nr:hypothetical protein [Clostridium sp.]